MTRTSRLTRWRNLVGLALATRLRDLTLKIYTRAAEYARSKGVIIADTKFEFGTVGGELVLGDEVLTPDSSRFWPLDTYEPGRAQNSYDKQFVRDYLERIKWSKTPPAPPLPPEIAAKTSEKYKGSLSRVDRPRAMNWLDLLLIVILAMSIATSFARGLTREIIGLVAAVAALFCGAWFYRIAGAVVRPYVGSREAANLIGFLLIVAVVIVLGLMVSWLIGAMMKAVGLSWLDRLLGAAFGVAGEWSCVSPSSWRLWRSRRGRI